MSSERKIAVVGTGYVGLPVVVAFGSRMPVIGFDLNQGRVQELKSGYDRNGEVTSAALSSARVEYTTDPAALRRADFIIVAVPTPVDDAKRPDLEPLLRASRTVGENLTAGTIVVFESTVYPGTTEDICVPALERASGLAHRRDFHVGYSPERINPGDREHTFTRIRKVVAGDDGETTDVIAATYGSVIEAGVFKASSIKVAEAAKVIENTQRDLNIALMNELAIIFSRIGIDTNDVLAAARTKWNFLGFTPGLVGGHCIGVDPYYLTHKAEQLGYHPQVILAGRRINDGMGEFVADNVILRLARQQKPIMASRVVILGATFKENVPDLRNSGVGRIVRRFLQYGMAVQVYDPVAQAAEAGEHGLELTALEDLRTADAVVLAVPHRAFVEEGWDLPLRFLDKEKGVVADVRGVLPREGKPDGVVLWRL
jgi:UDP-N-acetyl-D-galactosamine dehydrogenase